VRPYHLDLSAGDDFTANHAITFLIQRVPVPDLIESLQNRQFFLISNLFGETSAIGENIRFFERSHNPAHAGLKYRSKP
jgi:hypothetical protein